MKIQAIRIKNLASLEGNTEINFTQDPLSSAGIFAITGATGAGKSTILDALCLALYGKTPRYLQAKEIGIEIYDVQGSTISQGDVRGILRDGTADGFAEVDFVGVDGQNYRAKWSVRRARDKAEGSMQADNIELRNISSNIIIPGKKVETYKEIERLVGLNFEQFTRSVLLAQGDFTAFLKANKDEKASLLEKLTGTHIYSEISKKVYEKYKNEEMQLRDLNLRKEGIITLTEEELKTLTENQITINSQIEILEKQIDGLSKEISWHEQLAQLKTNQVLAETSRVNAIEVKTNAVSRDQKLQQAEQAQKTRTWVDALQLDQQQQEQKNATLKKLEEAIVDLQKQKEEQEKKLQESEKNLAEKNKSFAEAAPILEEAKRLDTIIFEKKEQLLKAKEEAEKATEKNKEHRVILQNKRTESDNLLTEIENLEKWKTANIDRKPIAENIDIILSKLQDAQKLLEALQSSAKDLSEVQNKIKAKKIEKSGLETNLEIKQKEWESLKKNYETQSKELLLIPIETINLEKNEVDIALENTIKAQAQWQLFYSLLVDFDALRQKQLKDVATQKTNEETLKQLNQRLINENIKKETSEQLLQKARLAATENVEKLRESLVDNEPCPVCGSENHPYALHSVQLENVLVELEKAHTKNESTYLSTLRQQSSLEQECQTLNLTIASQEENIVTKKIALSARQDNWDKFSIAKECHTLPNEQKASWIEERLKAFKMKQTSLQTQILAHATQKQQLETDKSKLDQLKETGDSLNNQIKDNKRDLDSLHEQQKGILQDQEKATILLDEIVQNLNPYFSVSTWMSNWTNSPEPFLEQIKSFTQKWNENIKKIEDDSRQQSILIATLKELETQSKSFLEDANQKRDIHSNQEKKIQALIEKRNTIFEGQSVQHIEVKLKESIAEAQLQVDGNKTIQQKLNLDSATAITQKKQLQKDIIDLDLRVETNAQKIQDWLNSYNQKFTAQLNKEELLTLLLLTNEWIEAEQTALKAIDDEVTKANSVLKERTQLLEQHKQKFLSERSLEEVTELNNTAKLDLEQNKQTKNEISFKLQQDENNKTRIGDLLNSIDKQASITENWSKLNEIIGSADGKKFRQIAQEYTLDVLLGYANIHLEGLSNRYRIQRIPDSLGLQVVDQDMGDEVRTVYSLSGGESFLVSLALALGLASLSSSRMKVESLFIDEGFGSLDPTTLNIAMDALERLHNQGRKVGVISHVQEMTERIPTQIKVSKMASGKSKVEVLG